jgi:hypothetical protein
LKSSWCLIRCGAWHVSFKEKPAGLGRAVDLIRLYGVAGRGEGG